MAGTLYVCATPIGNLGDITLRALEVLNKADMIAAEDTRTTQKLLNHFEIKTPCISYHKHNEKVRSDFLVSQLLQGKKVALVSDAGTPGISDPGQVVIEAAIGAGIEVVSVPGPSAFVAALVVSGLPAERFAFEGFLPVNRKRRKEFLSNLASDTRTLIFYEAPHRLEETLEDMLDILGNRRIAVIRELTKKFEETLRGDIAGLVQQLKQGHEARGEYVLVVEGCPEPQVQEEGETWKYLSLQEHVEAIMAKGKRKKEAVKIVAELRKLPRREVYNFVEKLDLDQD